MRNNGLLHKGVQTTSSKAFFGSVSDFAEIENWIMTLEDDKLYEILFHPGKFDPLSKSTLNKDRERDVQHIEDLNLITKKNNIKVVSYFDLNQPIYGKSKYISENPKTVDIG